MISLIAAQGKNRELGFNGSMPWHLPGDSAYFKKVTKGHTMIMGRRTFESLPGVLPGRVHVVVTRDPGFHKDHPRVRIRHDLTACLREAAQSEEEIFVTGGAAVYEQALTFASRVYLTQIDHSYPADTYFPVLSEQDWKLVSQSETQQLDGDEAPYRFLIYERRIPE